jgi:lipopolysaccharide transport system permease protein
MNIQPEIVDIEPRTGFAALNLSALWRYRELLYFLIWRDVKVRYKQTALGVAWIILQPLIQVVVFNVIFGILMEMPTGGVPYPIFALAGVLPWMYFSNALGRSATSLVGSSNLISKVYFPRLLIPMAGVLGGLLDLAVGILLLVPALIYYRIPVGLNILFLPLFLLLSALTALAFSLWLSALNVRFRDVNYLIPFLIQLWMYLTPVFYGRSLIPGKWANLLALNPMTAVIDGARWAILGTLPAGVSSLIQEILIALAVIAVVLVSGLVYFRAAERQFADII